ncbi:hypothetical protein AAMO2058_001723400, partial [Amorphochlora amoebiformis]
MTRLTKEGNAEKGWKLFEMAKRVGVLPNSYMYTAAVNALSKCNRWAEGLNLFKIAQNEGVHLSPIAYGVALGCMEKGAQWNTALLTIQGLEEDVNSVHYLSGMRAALRGHRPDVAIELFEQLREKSLAAESPLPYLLAVQALGRMKKGKIAEKITKRALTLFPNPDSSTAPSGPNRHVSDIRTFRRNLVNAAIVALGEGKRWESALRLLSSVPNLGINPDEGTFLAAAQACKEGGKGGSECAVELLDLADQYNIELGSKLMGAVLATDLDLTQSLELLEAVTARGVTVTSRAKNHLLNKCKAESNWQKALYLYRKFRDPSPYLYTSCAAAGEWEEALRLTFFARSINLRPSPETYNAEIDILRCGGRWLQAIDLYDNMISKFISPQLEAIGSLASCLNAGAHWQRAVDLFNNIKSDVKNKQRNFQNSPKFPNPQTSNSAPQTHDTGLADFVAAHAIAACGRAGKHDKAFLLFTQAKNAKLRLGSPTYNAIIASASKARKWEEALTLLTTALAESSLAGSKPNIL